MVKKNRTGIDFSKHELIITESEGLIVHYLKKPNTITQAIKFINTNGVLVVTGDYGNWMFCRSFVPDKDTSVSDMYWVEKLHLSSTQQGLEFDRETTKRELEYQIQSGLVAYGYQDTELTDMELFYNDCLLNIDESKENYLSNAYQELPSWNDGESIVYHEKPKTRLQYVFDGFDEICKRLGTKI